MNEERSAVLRALHEHDVSFVMAMVGHHAADDEIVFLYEPSNRNRARLVHALHQLSARLEVNPAVSISNAILRNTKSIDVIAMGRSWHFSTELPDLSYQEAQMLARDVQTISPFLTRSLEIEHR